MSRADDAVARPDSSAPVPTPFAPDLSGDDDPRFAAWAASLRAEQSIGDAIEAALVDLLIAAAHRLARIHRLEAEYRPGDTTYLRLRSHAERAWSRTLTDWQRARKAAASLPARSVSETEKPLPTPEPSAPEVPSDPPAPTEPFVLPEVEDWASYMEINPRHSKLWPVLKGTDITVEQIAVMLVEDWSPEDILKRFPILTPHQVAACLACEKLRMTGPWLFGEPMERNTPDDISYPHKPPSPEH